jgi:hypothetical protein
MEQMNDVLLETPVVTKESALNKVANLKAQMSGAEKVLEMCKEEISKELGKLLASGCPASFEHKGKYFSIKKRSGRYFTCESNVPFGSWLKKGKKDE